MCLQIITLHDECGRGIITTEALEGTSCILYWIFMPGALSTGKNTRLVRKSMNINRICCPKYPAEIYYAIRSLFLIWSRYYSFYGCGKWVALIFIAINIFGGPFDFGLAVFIWLLVRKLHSWFHGEVMAFEWLKKNVMEVIFMFGGFSHPHKSTHHLGWNRLNATHPYWIRRSYIWRPPLLLHVKSVIKNKE